MADPFIAINEIPLPIEINTPMRLPEDRGLVEESINGRPIRVVKKHVNNFEVETLRLTPREGNMFYHLLKGRGHYYPFEADLYSCKGLSPINWSGESLTAGYFNGGVSASLLEFELPLFGDWTCSFWLHDGTWSYYVVDSENDVFVDTVLGSLPGSVSIGEDSITFSNTLISDLVILPFLVDFTYIEHRYNALSSFGRLPRFKLSGKAVQGEPLYVARVTRAYAAFGRNGNFYSDGQILSVSFIEV